MAINNQIGRDVRNTLNDIETIKTIAEEAKLVSGQAKKAVENVDESVERANIAVENANNSIQLVEDIITELEGVDAVQFKNRQDGFDVLLAQKAQEIGATDFVELIQSHNEASSNVYVKKLGNRKLEIAIPYKDDLSGYYLMEKDTNDDYIKLKEGSVQSVKMQESAYMQKNYESRSSNWVVSAAPNIYTRVIGETFSFSFDGTGFDLSHYGDTQGGLWEFLIDGTITRQVSVYKSTAANYLTPVIRGLEDKNHTVVATFKGQDPANPLPVGTPRGWIHDYTPEKNNQLQTATIYKTGLNGVKRFSILNLNSNKEYALSVRPAGTTISTNWLPEHNSIGTVFSRSQKTWIDNKLVEDWSIDTDMKQAKSVRVAQDMLGYHSSDLSNPLAEIYTVHTFTSRGVNIHVKIKFLRATTIGSGYVMMFPVYPSFAKKLVTNLDEVIETTKSDGSNTELTKEASSFAFLNEGGSADEQNTVVAMTIKNPHKSLRVGLSGRRNPFYFVDHRDTTIQKLYPMVYQDYVAQIGESIESVGTFHIGEIPMANKMLT